MSTGKVDNRRKNIHIQHTMISNEIRQAKQTVANAKADLARARAQLRRAYGRELVRRNAQGETVESLAKAQGWSRQYAHKLMAEANTST